MKDLKMFKEVVPIEIKKIKSLESYDIERLILESYEEGYHFIKRLRDEFEQGINRFDKSGEALFVVIMNSIIIGIGGLNQDPYINKAGYGRVRHLYILPGYRGKGIGKIILRRIIDEAREHFKILLLRTNNEIADVMYCNEGFNKGDLYNQASHYLELRN